MHISLSRDFGEEYGGRIFFFKAGNSDSVFLLAELIDLAMNRILGSWHVKFKSLSTSPHCFLSLT